MSDACRVLVKEQIAEAGVELLRERFDVDVEIEMPAEDLPRPDRRLRRADRPQRHRGHRRPAGARADG